MFRAEDYIGFARTVKSEIRSMKNQRSIHYNWHDADGTVALKAYLPAVTGNSVTRSYMPMSTDPCMTHGRTSLI